jgi:small conductance mechanosensitive channel
MDGGGLSSFLVSGGLIIALMIVGLALVQFVARRVLRVIQTLKHLREARRQQLITFVQILQWGADLFIAGSGLLMLLSTAGVDITPLLASVGVAGLAVSLGAQTLIKDLVGGILVLVENQYAIGDFIQVGNVAGTVERLSLRATHVRDVNGHLYIVPNGEVRIVANQTRDWSRALVDVGVAYEADLERALLVLQESAAAFAQDPTLGPQLLEPPEVLGPLTLGDSAITVRVMVKTLPGQQWAVARELRKWVLAACEREGVDLPYPRQEVWLRHVERDADHSEDAQSAKEEL